MEQVSISKISGLGRESSKVVAGIMKYLDSSAPARSDSFYEYSTDGEGRLKLFHYLLYEGDAESRKSMHAERVGQLKGLMGVLGKSGFDTDKIGLMMEKGSSYEYPIFMGFDFGKNGLEKIKVYFNGASAGADESARMVGLAKNVMKTLCMKDRIMDGDLIGERIAFIGVDFKRNSGPSMKIYTAFSNGYPEESVKKTIENQFRKYAVDTRTLPSFFRAIPKSKVVFWYLLYRIDDSGRVNSVKCGFPLRRRPEEKNRLVCVTCDGIGIEKYYRVRGLSA